MNDNDTPKLVHALQQLLAVLEAEDVALRKLDLAAIDEATAAKLELEPALASALADPLPTSESSRKELARLRDDVTSRARANHRRLRASLVAVGDLVDQLTGTTRTTYGRNNEGPVRAVLTQTIG
jgi:hypothetical protein